MRGGGDKWAWLIVICLFVWPLLIGSALIGATLLSIIWWLI